MKLSIMYMPFYFSQYSSLDTTYHINTTTTEVRTSTTSHAKYTSILKVSNSTHYDNGTYVCTVSNSGGSATAQVVMKIIGK